MSLVTRKNCESSTIFEQIKLHLTGRSLPFTGPVPTLTDAEQAGRPASYGSCLQYVILLPYFIIALIALLLVTVLLPTLLYLGEAGTAAPGLAPTAPETTIFLQQKLRLLHIEIAALLLLAVGLLAFGYFGARYVTRTVLHPLMQLANSNSTMEDLPFESEVAEIGDLTQIYQRLEEQRVRAERELKNLAIATNDQQAAVSQSRAARVALLVDYCRETRTLLSSILGMVSVLRSTELSIEQQTQLAVVRESAELLSHISDTFLDNERMSVNYLHLQHGEFDLDNVIEEIGQFWQRRLEAKKSELNISLSEAMPLRLRGDEKRLRQILISAITALSEDGADQATAFALQVNTKLNEANIAEVDITLAWGDHLQSVANNAPTPSSGQSDDPAGAFDYATSLSDFALKVSKRLIEEMGGGLQFCYDEDNIVAIHVRSFFAVSENQAAIAAGIANLKANKASAGQLTILVAEDNPVNQIVVRTILENSGHRVRIAENGLEAVSAVICERFDLVLMDVQMPSMDGVAATQRIRGLSEEVQNIPIIALTANEMPGDREKYLAAGMNGYVTKPFRNEALFTAIADSLDINVDIVAGKKDTAQHASAPQTISPATTPASPPIPPMGSNTARMQQNQLSLSKLTNDLDKLVP